MSPRRKRWSYTAGEYSASVRVEERAPGGLIYVRVWDPTTSRQRRRSLGHRDRDEAIAFAEREAKKLRDGLEATAPRPTVGSVLEQYLTFRTPQKKPAVQAEDKRRAGMWRRILGAARRVTMLGSPEWASFKAQRALGALDPHGRPVAEEKRRPVSPRAVDADLQFMVAVLNWACAWEVRGRALLERNPWGAPAPGVKRSLERPKTLAPKRPIATYDRYLAIRAVSGRVFMKCEKDAPHAQLVIVGHGARESGGGRKRGGTSRLWMRPSYLGDVLDLVEQTGRRISAVLGLTYSDILREGGTISSIKWRPFKGSTEQHVPVSTATRETLERIVRDRGGIGGAPLFPSYDDVSRPVTRHVVREWLLEAETLAELPHLAGGAFHPFRRKWATERKALPDRDVAQVGGWKSLDVLRNSYQQADDETVLDVVNEPRKLRERKAKESA